MKFFYSLCFLLFLTACGSVDVVPFFNKNYTIIGESGTPITYEVEKNLAYGENELQNYDIYLPQSQPQKVPVIVLLHGGGWREGDKGFINPIVNALKQRNVRCAIVNMNHRLTSQSGIAYKNQIEDIDLLLKKIHSEAKTLNIVPKFFLIGVSSGGHLAMLYAYSADRKNLVEAVGGIASPVDLTTEKIRRGRMNQDIINLVGDSFNAETEAEYRNASPLFWLDKSSPPTIVFYGGRDTTVPPEQGEALKSKLEKVKNKHEYYFYPEQTHEWNRLPETIDKMLIFGEQFL